MTNKLAASVLRVTVTVSREERGEEESREKKIKI